MPYGSLYYKILAEKCDEDHYTEKRYHEIIGNEGVNPENTEYEEFAGNEIIIMACSNCNTSCKHCYISFKGKRDPNELYELVKKLHGKYKIELNGAELLTDPEYLKSFKLIGQHHIITNGKVFLDNPSIVEKLKENDIRTIALSCHFGVQSVISEITEFQLFKIIEFLKKNGFEVRLMTTINTKNYKNVLKMCDDAHDIGARAIKFTNFITQGNAFYMHYYDETKGIDKLQDTYKRRFFEQLEEARKKYDINDLLIERCGTFGMNPYSGHDHFKCECISKSIVLTPDNNIYPCIFLAKPGFEIGKYEDGKFYIQKGLKTYPDNCISDVICNHNSLVLRKEK